MMKRKLKLSDWSDKEKLACYRGNEQADTISITAFKKVKFKCGKCEHEFESRLDAVTRTNGSWCPYCAGRALCGNIACKKCFDRSLASWPYQEKLACYRGNEPTHSVAIKSNKRVTFECSDCQHFFESTLNNVTQNGRWCPYCSGRALCGNIECIDCFGRSFASWSDQAKMNCYSGNEAMHTIALASNKKVDFECSKCKHFFRAKVGDATRDRHWCPYCAGKAFCGNIECSNCFGRSLASWPDQEKLSCYRGSEAPHTIARSSSKKVDFQCSNCTHYFQSELQNVTKNYGSWCPFCVGNVCGKDDCTICDQACEVRSQCALRCDHPRKARAQTRVTLRWVCALCMKDVIARDPQETPLCLRAKISLEIYTLAELQRQAMDSHAEEWSFLLAEPTAWDCAILPGLNYKPDTIWIFGKSGDPFETAGACKIDISTVSYVLMLEVLEHGVEQHSKARNVVDETREHEIRSVFAGIPVGVVYVVMAHTQHAGAKQSDVFFQKVGTEYEVMKNRQSDWELRLRSVRDALVSMYKGKLDKTVHVCEESVGN